MSKIQAQKYWKIVYYIVTFWGGLLLWLYFFLNVFPLSWVIDVTKFYVPDIKVWQKVRFYSNRNVKYAIWWEVIEEINMLTSSWDDIIFRNKREVYAEKWNKTVTREVDYIHTATGMHHLALYIVYDLNLFGIHRSKTLEANYIVR